MNSAYRLSGSFIATLHLLVLLLCGWGSAAQKSPAGKNVLFIVVDDLKPELGCYGSQVVKSPNMDVLAGQSVLFTAAYCQQAICGPTRTSVLTGLRPDHTQVWDLKTKFREVIPGVVTLPEYFKANGYQTLGMGKVFDLSNTDKNADAQSWSLPFAKTFPLAPGYDDIAYGIYQNPEVKRLVKEAGNAGLQEQDFYGPNKDPRIRYSTECLDVPDDAYMDGAMANYAVQQLQALAGSSQPFFMAVGFKKPHLPFIAPKKYWDLYDRSKISIAPFQQPAVGSPDFAYHNAGELRSYAADIIPANDKGNRLQLPEDKQRELIHAYYACISYTDAQVGKLMAALKKTGLDKNTIVILWGDHGWHLGDHSQWCKHSNFEQAVRAPLMIKVPGITHGGKYEHPAEFVDIYPTLAQLAGLKLNPQLDGKSLVPALKNPAIPALKPYAISQYPRGFNNDPRGIMGYSLRNNRYRLTEWLGNSYTSTQPFDAAQVKALELYDYATDPLETKNLATDPAYKTVVESLSAQLHDWYLQQAVKK